MEHIKRALFSEQGMKTVNALFLLSLLFRNSGLILIAYTVWIAYLLYGIRTTSSGAVKAVYTAFSLFAAVMIVINAVFLVKGL
ncbi:hypothetical protein [Dysosmobacter sp.]|uniref:hypothetical protein n=1 Tax=Dysosmobacter sp. TaxID=2591382 RepID=UPI002A906F7B|nr:hypothetical protein [Dysosmobacter sp.]MDY3282229.1 hypothetical protein [Dysosmobacter sp.]